jgi:diguanylate cyclase (GGDEF)-like protein
MNAWLHSGSRSRAAASSRYSLTMRDQLTGLLTPEAFKLLVEHELLVARRYQRVDTLLVIDIENLKAINSLFGRESGDDTLRAVGRLLIRTARESDILGRIGDDEFAVFALDCSGDALAKRISAAVMRDPQIALGGPNRQLSVRVKIGISEVRPTEEFDDLLTRAGPAAFQRKER